jgi:FkbM family methyltransferase
LRRENASTRKRRPCGSRGSAELGSALGFMVAQGYPGSPVETISGNPRYSGRVGLDIRLWRTLPVRGPGRVILRRLARRVAREQVCALGPAGVGLDIDPRNPPEVSVYLWGTYEPEVVFALERLAGPTDTTVDIGANCGVLSALMARLSPKGRVLAIDPSAAACERVRQQLRLNDAEATIVNVALGERRADEQFLAGNVGIGVLPRADRAFTTGEVVDTVVVPLDAVVDEHAPDGVALIKIDTDGSEPSVLRGAVKTLRRDRPSLVFEFCPDGLRRRGESAGTLADELERCDYQLYAPVFRKRAAWWAGPAPVERYKPVTFESLRTGALPEGNMVALPAGAAYQNRHAALLR